MTPKDFILSENEESAQQLASSPLHSEELLFPPNEDSCELSVVCSRADYSASRIAHAVEDCDAHLINLNVTSTPHCDDSVSILLRIGLRNPAGVIRSLERYGYRVTAIHSCLDPLTDDSITERINQLIARLEV